MRTLILFLTLSLSVCAEVTVKQEPFSAIIAKSAKVEPRTDTVAVFLTERQAGEQTGAFLSLTSDTHKFVSPYIDVPGVRIEPSKTVKSLYLVYAPPGKYKVLLVESDPEKGINFSNAEVTVGTPPPVVVPPVTGDFAAFTKAVKDNAARLKDPKTQGELKEAYNDVMPLLTGKTYDECKATVTAARFFVFNQRQGPSRNVDWDSWRVAVDAELVKVVKVGDAAGYIKAITAIVNAL